MSVSKLQLRAAGQPCFQFVPLLRVRSHARTQPRIGSFVDVDVIEPRDRGRARERERHRGGVRLRERERDPSTPKRTHKFEYLDRIEAKLTR